MNIRIFMTQQGQIIGEVVDEYESGGVPVRIRLRNAAALGINGQNVQFVPLGQFVEDKEFDLNPDMLLMRNSFEPVTQLANKYRELFGSGIQVVSSMN